MKDSSGDFFYYVPQQRLHKNVQTISRKSWFICVFSYNKGVQKKNKDICHIKWYPFNNLDILFKTFITQSDILRIYKDTCIAWVTCSRHNTKTNAQCKGFTLTNIIIHVSILKYEHKKHWEVLGVWNIQASTININSTYTVYEQKCSESSKIKAHLHEMRRNFTQFSVPLI